MRREQVHVLVVLRQFESDVRDDDAERQRLDADLFIRILALGVEETHDVRVMGMQIDRARALARPELVGIGEAVLQELHHRNDAGGLVFDLFDRRAHLAQIGQRQRHASTALGKLQRRIDRAADAFHIVLDAQQEAGNQFAPLLLAGIEEGGGGRLEATGQHLVDEIAGQRLLPARQRQRHHAHPVLVPLQIALPVEGLQRVGGVIFEGAEEGGETEFPLIGAVEEIAHEIEGILVEHFLFVIALGHQIIELFPQVMEKDGVLVDVLEEILFGRHPVLVELDPPLLVIEVQHGVQRVIVQRRDFRGLCRLVARGMGKSVERLFTRIPRHRRGHRVQNRSNPLMTLATSSAVPRSSKR